MKSINHTIYIPKRKRKVLIPGSSFVRVLLYFFSLLLLILTVSLAASIHDTIYAWEEYDYYEILGLTTYLTDELNSMHSGKKRPRKNATLRKRRKKRAELKQIDIRKAYRKQAQLYHPDKFIRQQPNKNSPSYNSSESPSSTLSSSSSNIVSSLEEANSRFSRISEAYETLSDENLREEYDIYLNAKEETDFDELQKHQKEAQRQNENSWLHGTKSFFNDPKVVFANFFTGSSKKDDYETDFFQPNSFDTQSKASNSWWEDIYTGFSSRNQHGHSDHNHNDHKPQYGFENERPKVYERTEIMWNAELNRDILVVFRREEWTSSGRFIVMAQDFVIEHSHSYDMYGRNLRKGQKNYVPISDVYIVDEGFMENMDSSFQYDKESDTSNYEKSDESNLYPGDFMSPGEMIYSNNKLFSLLLTNDCELLIVRHDYENNEDKIIWNSDTYVGDLSSQCFLSLHGSQLLLYVGTNPSHITGILWVSPNPGIVPGARGYYFASLDDDGVLVIYRTLELDEEFDNFYHFEADYGDVKGKKRGPLEWLENKLQKKSSSGSHGYHHHHQSSAKASQAWDKVREWTLAKLKARKQSKSNICIWSTSPFGCFTSGRKALVIGSSIKRSLQKAIVKVDFFIDEFVEGLGNEEDEIDVLDTLGRMMEKVSVSIGNTGKKMAKKGLAESKMIRDTLREQLRRWEDEKNIDVLDRLGRVVGKVSVGIGNTGKKMAKKGLAESKMIRDTLREQIRRWAKDKINQ